VTGTGPRIAAASAAVVVSAAVAGAALFGGSATRNPGVPVDHDQRPASVPTTPSASPTPSRTNSHADVDSTARECIVQQGGSECEAEHRLTATASTRSTTQPGAAGTDGERRATSDPTGKRPATKQNNKGPRSARGKTASPAPPGHTKGPKG
jgi:hypothetical protein